MEYKIVERFESKGAKHWRKEHGDVTVERFYFNATDFGYEADITKTTGKVRNPRYVDAQGTAHETTIVDWLAAEHCAVYVDASDMTVHTYGTCEHLADIVAKAEAVMAWVEHPDAETLAAEAEVERARREEEARKQAAREELERQKPEGEDERRRAQIMRVNPILRRRMREQQG